MIAFEREIKWIVLVGVVWISPAVAQLFEKFANLKVLPKDISRAELQSTMRGFAFALNVRYIYCHVEKPNGEEPEMDFAADDKDEKKTAWVMLEMVTAISSTSCPKHHRLRCNASPATTD